MNKYPFLGEIDRRATLKQAAIVVVPVPFDQTCSWQKGAARGPQAILEASPHLEFYDIETETEVYRKGIYTDDFIERPDSTAMIEAVFQRVARHLKNDKFVVTLGGEHTVALGAIKAHLAEYRPMTVLQLDAHTDLRDSYEGSPYSHACVMARVREICPIVQIGIRSMDISEKAHLDRNRVFFAHDIVDGQNWIHSVIDCLTENVYVTIDLDVFDSGLMPATGTPEPGGLGWYQVFKLLKAVSERANIVGFDVVELCPSATKAPDYLAAKLIYKLLSYIWR